MSPEEQRILDEIPIGANFERPKLADPEVMLATYRSDPVMKQRLRNKQLRDALESGNIKAIDDALVEQFRSDMKIWTAFQNKLVC